MSSQAQKVAGAGAEQTRAPRNEVFVDIKVAHNMRDGDVEPRTLLKVKTNAPLQDHVLACLISKVLSKTVLVPDNAEMLSDTITKHLETHMQERNIGEAVVSSRKFRFEILDGSVRLPAPAAPVRFEKE